MDKFILKFSLLLFLGITLPLVCTAQDISTDNYKWLQGEWRNTIYGDILEIDAEGLQFLKNGLVFDVEEMPDEKPETIEDLIGSILNSGKVPYQFGYFQDTLSGASYFSILFDYRANTYPFEMEKTWLGLDAENNLVFYLNQNGDKVFLNKFSDLTFEERLASELKEKQERLSAMIDSNQFAWLHGQWNLDFMFNRVVNIDNDSIKIEEKEYDEATGRYEVGRTEKQPVNLQYKINDFTHEVELALMLMPYEIFVDKTNESIYSYYDFDQRIGFEKVSEFTEQEQLAIAQKEEAEKQAIAQKEEAERQAAYRKSQIIKYSIWAGIGIAGIVLLLLLIRWIKKMMPKIKASTTKASDKAKEKAKEISEKAKESKDKLIDKSKELMEKGKAAGEQSIDRIKTAVEEKGDGSIGKKSFTPWLISLFGVYSIIFFDIYIGLLLLIPAIIYLILRKVNPDKAERLVNTIKNKLQPITSKPMLKHGLVALLMGIVVLRTLGIIPGWFIIGLSVVFLALTKFAPAFAKKIDNGCAGISDKLKLKKIWQNNWVKVAVFVLLLLVPILGVRPGQSVYSIAQSENTSNTFIQKGRNSKSSNQAHSNGIKTTTFSYQSDIMAYLRSHKFVASNGNYLTFSNSWITNEKAKRTGVTQYEILKWDSKTALVNAHTPYGTPPITIYVYAAEGHIIIDDTMYFAK